MKMTNSVSFKLAACYFLLSSILGAVQWQHFHDQRIFRTIQEEIHTDFGLPLWQTRLFHNKPIAISRAYLSAVYKHLDLAYIFSLPGLTAMYGSYPDIGVLTPIELPLFIFAVIIIIRSTTITRRVKSILLFILFIILLYAGATTPVFTKDKIVILAIYLRMVISLSIITFSSFFQSKQWKNIFS